MATAFLEVKNRAVSTLASGIDNAVTSLSVAAGEGALFPSAFPFHITIDDEILSCTNRSTDTLTVVRARQGTVAAAHSIGAALALNITAKNIADLNAAVSGLEKVTTKGDLLVATGDNVLARRAVGADGEALTADSAQADGLKWAVAAAGALTLEGSNTSEATTTSTSVVDLLTVSSLSIAAAVPILVLAVGRKTTGAANGATLGIKLNAAAILAQISTKALVVFTGTDEAQVSVYNVYIGPRVTNYLFHVIRHFITYSTGWVKREYAASANMPDFGAAMPTDTITDVIINGRVYNASLTVAADEMHVYSYAVA